MKQDIEPCFSQGRELRRDQIYNDILKEIEDGAYSQGKFLPKERELAQYFEVGRTTLRKALLKLKEKGYVASRHRLGWEVISNKSCNTEAKTKNKKKIMVLALPDTGVIEIMTPAIREQLSRKGYDVDFHLLSNTVVRDNVFPKLELDNITGLISIVPISLPNEIVDKCKEKEIPICSISLQEECDYDTVANNRSMSSKMAVEYLLSKGHENILYLSAQVFLDRKIPVFIAGKLGYEQAMIMNDLNPESLLNPDNIWVRDLDEKLIIDKIKNLEKENRTPTAIYAETNYIVNYLVPILERNGYKVPQDISVIGVGCQSEETPLTSYGINKITSLVPQNDKLVEICLDSILSRINGQKRPAGLTTVKPIITEGDTVIKRQK